MCKLPLAWTHLVFDNVPRIAMRSSSQVRSFLATREGSAGCVRADCLRILMQPQLLLTNNRVCFTKHYVLQSNSVWSSGTCGCCLSRSEVCHAHGSCKYILIRIFKFMSLSVEYSHHSFDKKISLIYIIPCNQIFERQELRCHSNSHHSKYTIPKRQFDVVKQHQFFRPSFCSERTSFPETPLQSDSRHWPISLYICISYSSEYIMAYIRVNLRLPT